jgi:hypothetical protein
MCSNLLEGEVVTTASYAVDVLLMCLRRLYTLFCAPAYMHAAIAERALVAPVDCAA